MCETPMCFSANVFGQRPLLRNQSGTPPVFTCSCKDNEKTWIWRLDQVLVSWFSPHPTHLTYDHIWFMIVYRYLSHSLYQKVSFHIPIMQSNTHIVMFQLHLSILQQCGTQNTVDLVLDSVSTVCTRPTPLAHHMSCHVGFLSRVS